MFTDLDGTLLDDDYRWDVAEPALKALKLLGFPIVLSSSKTLDEMVELASALDTRAPLIAENGGLVAVPRRDPFAAVSFGDEIAGAYAVAYTGLRRDDVVAVAHRLRTAESYRFVGFHDWGVAEVREATGLSEAQARLALKRLATEPILWEDTEARWAAFAVALRAEGVNTVKGGRFVHLSGNIDKAMGLERVLRLYRELEPEIHWHVVALGDSPNDLAMLSAADSAVVIPNPRHPAGLDPAASRVIRATQPGPRGWNTALQELLQPYLNPV